MTCTAPLVRAAAVVSGVRSCKRSGDSVRGRAPVCVGHGRRRVPRPRVPRARRGPNADAGAARHVRWACCQCESPPPFIASCGMHNDASNTVQVACGCAHTVVLTQVIQEEFCGTFRPTGGKIYIAGAASAVGARSRARGLAMAGACAHTRVGDGGRLCSCAGMRAMQANSRRRSRTYLLRATYRWPQHPAASHTLQQYPRRENCAMRASNDRASSKCKEFAQVHLGRQQAWCAWAPVD